MKFSSLVLNKVKNLDFPTVGWVDFKTEVWISFLDAYSILKRHLFLYIAKLVSRYLEPGGFRTLQTLFIKTVGKNHVSP